MSASIETIQTALRKDGVQHAPLLIGRHIIELFQNINYINHLKFYFVKRKM